MIAQLTGVGFVIALSLISALSYRHDGPVYRQGKSSTIPCLLGFRLVHRWIQITTAVLACASFLSDAPWLLKLPVAPAQLYCGLAIAALGLALFVWAKRTLGLHYSPCFDSYVPCGLVTSGPYAWIRHPIYTANLLGLIGLSAATGSAWLVLNTLLLAVYYVDSARREEVELSRFLAGYAEYVQRTRPFLPWLPLCQPASTTHGS